MNNRRGFLKSLLGMAASLPIINTVLAKTNNLPPIIDNKTTFVTPKKKSYFGFSDLTQFSGVHHISITGVCDYDMKYDRTVLWLKR